MKLRIPIRSLVDETGCLRQWPIQIPKPAPKLSVVEKVKMWNRFEEGIRNQVRQLANKKITMPQYLKNVEALTLQVRDLWLT